MSNTEIFRTLFGSDEVTVELENLPNFLQELVITLSTNIDKVIANSGDPIQIAEAMIELVPYFVSTEQFQIAETALHVVSEIYRVREPKNQEIHMQLEEVLASIKRMEKMTAQLQLTRQIEDMDPRVG